MREVSGAGAPSATRRASDGGSGRIGWLVRAAVRVETGYAVLLVATFVLPRWIGFQAWIPALALAIGLAIGHGLLARRRPILPPIMLAYLGLYAVAALHSDPDTFSLIEAGKYFVPPVFALAVAWAAHDAAIRRRMVMLSIAAVGLQLPVAVAQTAQHIVELGWDDAVLRIDAVTGLLGLGAPGTLTQTGIFIAILLLSAGYLGTLGLRWALPAAAALCFLMVLTNTRAGYIFILVGLGATAVALWLAVRAFIDRPSIRAAILTPVLLIPLLFVATDGLYPGTNSTVTSFSELWEYVNQRETATEGVFGEEIFGAEDSRSESEPTTSLPSRGKQLTLAVELTVQDGPDRTLLGEGMGATRFKNQGLLSRTGPTTDAVTREEQLTNSVWLPRVITETGFIGVVAFFGLLAYLVALTVRNRALLRSPSWDGAVMLALPGIAALTLVSALFNTALAIQPYATLFWSLLGIAIAIDAAGRSRSA